MLRKLFFKIAFAVALIVIISGVLLTNSIPPPFGNSYDAEPANIFIPPPVQITEYGRKVAEEFLSQIWSLFSRHGRKDLDTGNIYVRDDDIRYWVQTTELPIFSVGGRFIGSESHYSFRYEAIIFDYSGNEIETPSFVSVETRGNWTVITLPHDFALYDLDNSGIPDIVIFPDFPLGYDGGPWSTHATLYRYIDGRYTPFIIENRMQFFYDQNGEIIAFSDIEHYLVWMDIIAVYGLPPSEWNLNISYPAMTIGRDGGSIIRGRTSIRTPILSCLEQMKF